VSERSVGKHVNIPSGFWDTAAFDTVDHTCLLTILRNQFSVDTTVASWFQSYLTDRSQTFSAGRDQSFPVMLYCSVPQGSVLAKACAVYSIHWRCPGAVRQTSCQVPSFCRWQTSLHKRPAMWNSGCPLATHRLYHRPTVVVCVSPAST